MAIAPGNAGSTTTSASRNSGEITVDVQHGLAFDRYGLQLASGHQGVDDIADALERATRGETKVSISSSVATIDCPR